MKPVRIQRKRAKGWKMPEGAVYVGRPTKWGNPFKVSSGNPAHICRYGFAIALMRNTYPIDGVSSVGSVKLSITVEDVERELRGKDLACWCPLDQPCHADVLLEIANS